jgi:serine/threonine protein phosphatase PrpC
MAFAPVRIESRATTDVGLVRDHNEDGFCARDRHGLWAVADGMGGLEGGDWASGRLIEQLERVAPDPDFDSACQRVADAIGEAHRSILAEADRRGRQMGSTIVALLVRDRRFALLWVGDSRAYLMRGGELLQLSRDHSQVQEMVDRGLLPAEEAAGHPLSHILTRAVGIGEEVGIDRADGEVRPGDVFLLCSDGLHGYVDQRDIARALARGPPERTTEELVELTLASGAPDNVTVVVIRAGDPATSSPEC